MSPLFYFSNPLIWGCCLPDDPHGKVILHSSRASSDKHFSPFFLRLPLLPVISYMRAIYTYTRRRRDFVYFKNKQNNNNTIKREKKKTVRTLWNDEMQTKRSCYIIGDICPLSSPHLKKVFKHGGCFFSRLFYHFIHSSVKRRRRFNGAIENCIKKGRVIAYSELFEWRHKRWKQGLRNTEKYDRHFDMQMCSGNIKWIIQKTTSVTK